MPRKKERLSTRTLSKECGNTQTWWTKKMKDNDFWDKVWVEVYKTIRKMLKK